MKKPKQASRTYLKLHERLSNVETNQNAFNTRLALTSAFLAQMLKVIDVLKTKGIITDAEIEEAIKEANEEAGIQVEEGSGVDTPAGDDSVHEEEELVREGDSGERVPERDS